MDYEIEYKRLQIESENLKNILNSLNDQLSVFNDLKKDVLQHKNMLKRSEDARFDLQK